jgi:hypothetical protein
VPSSDNYCTVQQYPPGLYISFILFTMECELSFLGKSRIEFSKKNIFNPNVLRNVFLYLGALPGTLFYFTNFSYSTYLVHYSSQPPKLSVKLPHLGNFIHRVYRAPGFLSSRPNWIPLTTSTASECYPPSFGSKGETHSLAGEGVGGGPNSNEGTDTLVYYNLSLVFILLS